MPIHLIAKDLENFVAFSWWFFACPFQNLSCFLYICMGSSLTKEFFRTQRGDFLGNGQVDELVKGDSLALGRFSRLRLQ